MTQDSDPMIDPELEARIVALVLGEASDFERDELARLLNERPDLAAFKATIEGADDLIQEFADLREIDGEDDWKLPDDKRKVVLDTFDGKNIATSNLPSDRGSVAKFIEQRSWSQTLVTVAALIAFVAVGSLLMMPKMSVQDRNISEIASFANDVPEEAYSESPQRQYPLDASTPNSLDEFIEFDAKLDEATDWDVDEMASLGFELGQKPVTKYRVDEGRPNIALSVDSKSYRDASKSALSGIQDQIRGSRVQSAQPTTPSQPKLWNEREREMGRSGTQSLGRTSEGFRNATDAAEAFDGEAPSGLGSPGASWELRQTLSDGSTHFVEPQSNRGASPTMPSPSSGSSIADMELDAISNQAGQTGGKLFRSGGGGFGNPNQNSDAASTQWSKERVLAELAPLKAEAKLKQKHDDLNVARGLQFDVPQPASPSVDKSGTEVVRNSIPRFSVNPEKPSSNLEDQQARLSKRNSSAKPFGDVADKMDRWGSSPTKSSDVLAASEELDYSFYMKIPSRRRQNPQRPESEAKAIPSSPESEKLSRSKSLRELNKKKLKREQFGLDRTESQSLGESEEFYGKDQTVWSDVTVPQNVWRIESRPTPEISAKLSVAKGLDERSAQDESFSTFSLHVSDVSFKLARTALAQGKWPDQERVRIEEFVNAFDYGDPLPGESEYVACGLEQCVHPFYQQRNLLRVSMRTACSGRSTTTPLRLTLLLDNSGSMERSDRRQTIRRAFTLLANQLLPTDRITLISFARKPRLLADRFDGARAAELVQRIENLPSEGGTNLEEALQLAFEKAKEQKEDGAQNRIILLTDGAVNLGNANPDGLSQMVHSMRNQGIAFDAAGISADGLNDEVLESLTRKGDGRYYVLDSADDADDGFAKQIAGAMRPSAKNVKVQLEFNPNRVGRYKLLGFEKHRLNKEDFRNDKVDAAEMAAEEAGVAVYQFEAKPDGQGDIGSVSVRFQDLASGQMVEKRWPIPFIAGVSPLQQANASMRIAATAALFAAKLRGEPIGEPVDLGELSQFLSSLPDQYRSDRVAELRAMIQQARNLSN